MSDAAWDGLFRFLEAATVGILGYMGVRLTILQGQVKKTLKQTEETHLAVNSRMDELLKLAKSSSRAEGKLEGQAENGPPD